MWTARLPSLPWSPPPSLTHRSGSLRAEAGNSASGVQVRDIPLLGAPPEEQSLSGRGRMVKKLRGVWVSFMGRCLGVLENLCSVVSKQMTRADCKNSDE